MRVELMFGRIHDPLRFEETYDASGKFLNLLRVCLALPDHQDSPSHSAQHPVMLYIPFLIAFQLGTPEIQTRFWHSVAHPAMVSMPEASVDKYDFLAARKEQVRRAREILNM
jgi:hypothetical protein